MNITVTLPSKPISNSQCTQIHWPPVLHAAVHLRCLASATSSKALLLSSIQDGVVQRFNNTSDSFPPASSVAPGSTITPSYTQSCAHARTARSQRPADSAAIVSQRLVSCSLNGVCRADGAPLLGK